MSSPPDRLAASDRAPATAVTGLDGATLFGVTVAGDGSLVAVGSAGTAAAAWTSIDGASWRRAEVALDGGPVRFRTVAVGEGGLIAFAGSDDEVSSVWRSDDGGAWSPVDSRGITGRINAATFSDGQWFAAGDLIANGQPAEGGEALGGAVYSSADGRSWQIVTDELFTTEATVSDIATAGNSTIVVAGFDGDGGAVWLDPTERPEPITDGFEGATVQGLAPVGPGLAALGRGIADLRPVAWTSPDGATWERLELDVAVFGPDEQIHDLAQWGDRLIAVGAAPDGGVVWTSGDGQVWTRGP